MLEHDIQSIIKVKASEEGCRLWRNNVGALTTTDGRFIRFGLANESKSMNDVIKSADLIGIRPIIITQDMVGTKVGVFLSREVKRPNAPPPHPAQVRWMEIVNALGGDAKIIRGEDI